MEKAYALLGVDEEASLEEIKKAYREKKRLYDPSRFVDGSLDQQFARARNAALDEAYSRAAAAAQVPAENISGEETDGETDYEAESFPWSEIFALAVLFPAAVCFVQYLTPAVLYNLTPGLRRAVWLLDAVTLFLSYSLPLLLRFVFLKRPLKSLSAALLFFPLTLLSADFFLSALLHASFLLSRNGIVYVPAVYLTGWAIFPMLSAHCAILMASPRAPFGKGVFSSFRRLAAYTLTLALSAAVSLYLGASLNRIGGGPGGTEALPAAETALTPQSSPAEDPWQTIELRDAGVMRIPASWYVEDSNGKHTQVWNGDAVQHVREALTARPYGRRERGLDFAFEFLVYWWTQTGGRTLPPPQDALDRIQERQLEALRQNFPDAAVCANARFESGERTTLTLTVETRSIPEAAVRFRSIVFKQGDKLYSLVTGYPAYEEEAWDTQLGGILRSWSPEP